jgi:hypothetical protein
MRNPFKKGEILDDGGEGSCLTQALSIVALVGTVLGGLGYLAYYGVSEFLARV